MNFIVEFYQSLDALNVIIFWGIIIVILLLIVFVILMINKVKNKTNNKPSHDEIYSDEVALPTNSRDTLIMKDDNLLIQEEKQTNFEPFVIPESPVTSEKVEVEKKFQAEEHVMEYDNELFNLSHVKKNNELPPEEPKQEPISEKQPFQMPTKPYERNVLREMSLGQTSPIGIVKQDNSYNKLVSKPKDSVTNYSPINSENQREKLTVSEEPIGKIVVSMPKPTIDEHSLVSNEELLKQKSPELLEKNIPANVITEIPKQEQPAHNLTENNIILESSITEQKVVNTPEPPKKPEIINQVEITDSKPHIEINNHTKIAQPQVARTPNNEVSISEIKPQISKKEKITQQEAINNPPSNAAFLEEVSRKLAEAEVPDEIDRTDYELQQEEDAIISYKELMAKKDTIKTIDEEDAIISIQELTARKNQQEKLYNLTENEENNDFIDELKKFRNDLN